VIRDQQEVARSKVQCSTFKVQRRDRFKIQRHNIIVIARSKERDENDEAIPKVLYEIALPEFQLAMTDPESCFPQFLSLDNVTSYTLCSIAFTAFDFDTLTPGRDILPQIQKPGLLHSVYGSQ
jgi:hypothetical protein